MTWVLITYHFFYLFLSLRSFSPTSVPHSSSFRNLAGMTLPPTLTPTVHLQRNTRVFFFPLLLLFTFLALNAAKSSISFGRIKPIQKPGGLLRWKVRLGKDARLSLPLTEVMKIAKAKAEAWPTTCSSLSPKSNLESVHSLCSIAGSSSSSPNFLNCSSPRKSASIYAAYLRFNFSISQPKALRSRARNYLSELRRATCPEESHSSFCSPFSPAKFFAASSNVSWSTATGPDKVAYSMLKHLPRSRTDFLLHIFNLSWTLHSFPFIWKTSSIIHIHKMGKPLDSPAFFQPTSLTSCVSKLFERIIHSCLPFFLEFNSILSPCQADFRRGRSTLDQILYLSQSIVDGFNKQRSGSRTIPSTIDFSKTFDSVWHPTLFHKLISAGLPPCFARWTQSFLSDRCACVVHQNHKSRSFRVRRGVPQGSVLGPVRFSSSMIFLLLGLLPSAALFMLTIWPFGPPIPRPPLR